MQRPALGGIVLDLLNKRGITDPEAQARFLRPDFARDTHDPFLLQDMDRAVARIFEAMSAGERIAIYGDFDCDGIPGSAVLFETFKKIGYKNVEVYIPHRDREGYGFHVGAIDTLKERGVSLIITVDVGTVAFEGVAHARSLGVDVIVTDHHELKDALPDCVVINPKRGEYPFRDLCGAGVAWKLASALLQNGRESSEAAFAAIPEGWEKWLLDLVAIATVADLVPLVGENRALVHFGLTVLRKSRRSGLRALATSARVRLASMTEDDIGFTIAPRINAASRMDAPELAFRLLTTENDEEAETLARELESLNRRRRGAVAAMTREAKARARARYHGGESVIVLGDISWKPSLCGLVANALMEERRGMVCIWGEDAEGRLKGSCRSDGARSVVEVFTSAKTSLIEFGGHHASGGFSVSREAVHTLPDVLRAVAEGIGSRAETGTPSHDAEILVSDVSPALMRELERLAPFGTGNPKPVFRVCEARITFARQFGKEMNHTEVTLLCARSGVSRRAFQFFKTPTDFTFPPSPGSAADVLATIERDTFRGPGALALRLQDILSPR